jgi:hypothetical protein
MTQLHGRGLLGCRRLAVLARSRALPRCQTLFHCTLPRHFLSSPQARGSASVAAHPLPRCVDPLHLQPPIHRLPELIQGRESLVPYRVASSNSPCCSRAWRSRTRRKIRCHSGTRAPRERPACQVASTSDSDVLCGKSNKVCSPLIVYSSFVTNHVWGI